MTIRRDDIPQGVLDEIAQHYETVIWDHYGDHPKDNVVSRKTSHHRIIAENVECTVLDSETFEPKTIVGTQKESHIVSGVFTDTACDVYAGMSAGIAVVKHREWNEDLFA